jgi:P-type E1-E2 ATPase
MKAMFLFQNRCLVLRENKIIDIESQYLLPGDILYLKNNQQEDYKIPCDCIIIYGEALIDEKSLTGESIPVLKSKSRTKNGFLLINNSKPKRPLKIKHFNFSTEQL